MSDYSHDLKKFADTGLQLRLPVDLIPATQYGRLTNALPVIEGELRTREGLTLIGNVTQVAFIQSLFTQSLVLTHVVGANTTYPHGFVPGDTVVINIIAIAPGEANSVSLGQFTVLVTSLPDAQSFVFDPPIPAVLVSNGVSVLAQATSTATLNALTNTQIDNIFRLNQAITSLASDRIVTMNGRIFRAPLPAGNVFEELIGPFAPGAQPPTQTMGFSGRPMSIIEFRFTRDSASWAIFADQDQMYKYRPGTDDTQLEMAQLGNAPPTIAASYSAGSTGNLNSTGGTGYDWRYTYVDGYAFTESNPSPINMTSGGTSTTRPTTFTNPATVGNTAFANPSNAIDGSTTTGSTGSENATSSTSTTVTRTTSCKWQGWAQPAGVVDAVTLNVVASLTATARADQHATATGTCYLEYSFDAGASWQTLKTITAFAPAGTLVPITVSTGKQTYSATLPSSAAFANFTVRARGVATARGQLIFGLDYTGDSSVSLTLYDINTTVVQEGVVNALALVNKIGVVCVTPSPYPQHKFINLYRRGGSLPDAWRLVGQFQQSALVQGTCGAGTLEIDDNVSDTTLSTAAILELDNDQPVTSVTKINQPLSFIWGPVGLDARVLGCGDPARPESVYYSKPGNADAWPPQNFVEVSSPGTPILAGCVFNTRTFAFSRESIYELVEGLGTGSTFSPFRTPSAHGLYTPWGLAIGPAMYFIAKDGIYETTGGQEVSLVENDIKPLFPTYDKPGRSVEGYEAVDYSLPDNMRLRYHNDELYFEYTGLTTGTRQVLVYDILKKRWRAMACTAGITEIYSEPATTSSLLYGTTAGTIYQAAGNFDPSDLDIIENMSISSVTTATSFATSTMYVRAVRYISAGAVAVSWESSVNVSAAVGIQATFPTAPPGTTAWRLFYGTTQGAEDQYQEFTEASLAASRTVTIIASGTAGILPTANASNKIAVVLRTGAHDQGVPLNRKQYGNVLIDLDPGGATVAAPVTITPYVNGEAQAQAALTVTGTGRQQVPLDLSDYFAFNTEYEVSWSRTDVGGGVVTNPILFQYDTLHFFEPVGVTHWQAQPTSFAFPGFMHVRDCYVAIRSTADATLTVTIDVGKATPVVQTYTIPSTGGQRLKQYIQLAPNKGLSYQFAIDCAQEFRVYQSDLEQRVKPWLGVLGYAVQRELGGEVNA